MTPTERVLAPAALVLAARGLKPGRSAFMSPATLTRAPTANATTQTMPPENLDLAVTHATARHSRRHSP